MAGFNKTTSMAVFDKIKDDEKLKGCLVSPRLDTNEVLSVTDVLVSDYSSIFFDFLVTDRPIMFYIPDLEEYKGYKRIVYGA